MHRSALNDVRAAAVASEASTAKEPRFPSGPISGSNLRVVSLSSHFLCLRALEGHSLGEGITRIKRKFHILSGSNIVPTT